MKLIPLSQKGKNKGKYFAMVDDEDFEYLNQFKWSIKNYRNMYPSRTVYEKNRKFSISMHQAIMGRNDKMIIDHKDGNVFNNQKDNLRFCTHSENSKNRKGHGKSKYHGVSLHKTTNRYGKEYFSWQSAISINKKNTYLGKFKTEIEAALAYNIAALKHHGEFANLNKI